MANYQNEYYNHRNIYAMSPGGGGSLIGRGLGVYEADGDGDAEGEGEDCLDGVNIPPPVAIPVRDSGLTRGSGTTAHGATTSDSTISHIANPPLFGKNTLSTHAESSLFRDNSAPQQRNNAYSEARSNAGLFGSRTTVRTGGAFPGAGHRELGSDVFTDGSHTDSDDTLQCPRCKQEYPTQSHGDFLDHVDKCCD